MFGKAKERTYTKDDVISIMTLMGIVSRSFDIFADTARRTAIQLHNSIVDCDNLLREIDEFTKRYELGEEAFSSERTKLNSYKELMVSKLEGMSAE